MTDSTISHRNAVAVRALSLVVFAPSFAATKVAVDGLGVATSSMTRLRPALLSVMLDALPPLAVLADWLLIGEEPHRRDLAGGALILVGAAIGTRRSAE